MKKAGLLLLCVLLSCRVTFITGYDAILDETAVKMKRDFNLFWLKLDRSIKDSDPRNQEFSRFQEYYDQMETDLLILTDRAAFLPQKSAQVQSQVRNIGRLLSDLKNMHKKGIRDIAPDDPLGDDKRDYRKGINYAINALMVLQSELKTAEKS